MRASALMAALSSSLKHLAMRSRISSGRLRSVAVVAATGMTSGWLGGDDGWDALMRRRRDPYREKVPSELELLHQQAATHRLQLHCPLSPRCPHGDASLHCVSLLLLFVALNFVINV